MSSGIQRENQKSFLQRIDSNLFEKIMCMSLPTLNSNIKQKKPLLELRSSIGVLSRMLTNIDILNPATYFYMQLFLIVLQNSRMIRATRFI